MKCIAVVLLFCTMSLARSAVAADRPRNIFDDDWTPPKTAEKPRPPATVVPPPSLPADAPAKNSKPTTPWKEGDPGTGGIISPPIREARIAIRYQPPKEYDFHIEFTRLSGQPSTVQILTHGGHLCAWLVGWEDRVRGFETIGGRDAGGNATTVKGPAISTIGQRYSSVVQVRRGGLAAYLDGKLVAEYKTDGSDLSVKPHWVIGDFPLGLGGSSNETLFHVVEIREVTGRGKSIQ